MFYWIPEGHEHDSYSEENIKEIPKMVKKHMLLHPLIPINKETFFTSTEIYHHIVEAYTYCRERNFVRSTGIIGVSLHVPLARTTIILHKTKTYRVMK